MTTQELKERYERQRVQIEVLESSLRATVGLKAAAAVCLKAHNEYDLRREERRAARSQQRAEE